jgi:hypothetical protein
MPRPLFTDGINSLSHFAFGVASAREHFIVPGFAFYQLVYKPDEDEWVDLSEFLIGWLVAKFIGIK